MAAKGDRHGVRSRGWAFTINNYTEGDGAAVEALNCEYLVCGREKGAQGTEHMQCYVYFAKRMSFARVRVLLGGRAHIEAAKGSPAQNRAYCIKDGDFIERGTLPKPGKRTDLMDMRDLMKAGEPLYKIVDQARSYQALKGAEALSKYDTTGATKKTAVEVLWYWGPTGSGKTYTAYKTIEDRKLQDDLWVSSDSLQWFDGYGGQSAVLLDDIRRDDVKFNFLLRLLDGYRIRVPIKGSFVTWMPMLIIITAPMDPSSFCPCTENNKQLLRRITTVREFKERVVDQDKEPIVIE